MELEVLRLGEFKKLLKREDIVLIDWKLSNDPLVNYHVIYEVYDKPSAGVEFDYEV